MHEKISTLFVGMDIHKDTHTLVGANIACESLCELTFNNNLNGFQKAIECIESVAKKNKLKPIIGLEDSNGNGTLIARFLSKHNYAVKTVNPVLVDRNRKYSTHPEKSDSQDALGVAEVLVRRTDKLPDFTLTQNVEFAKDIETLVKDREELICQQTRLKNKLHADLTRHWGVEYKDIYRKDIFGKKALLFWNKYPGIRVFKKTTKPIIEKPKWIINAKPDSLPLISNIQQTHIRRLIKRLQIIKEQITEIDNELKELANANYSYLLTLPGCGVVTASKIIAYVKDINRFSSERKLARYSGIAPRKCESGNTRKDISSTRGHSALRRAFKAIALSQVGRRGNQKSKEYFRKKQDEGKTKTMSLKCLMRQNVKIVFCMLKEQRPYY